MANQSAIKYRANISFGCVIELSEAEARALNALTLYGDKNFLEAFYTTLGSAYLGPNEAGLVSLFKTIRETMPHQLDQIDEARRILGDK